MPVAHMVMHAFAVQAIRIAHLLLHLVSYSTCYQRTPPPTSHNYLYMLRPPLHTYLYTNLVIRRIWNGFSCHSFPQQKEMSHCCKTKRASLHVAVLLLQGYYLTGLLGDTYFIPCATATLTAKPSIFRYSRHLRCTLPARLRRCRRRQYVFARSADLRNKKH